MLVVGVTPSPFVPPIIIGGGFEKRGFAPLAPCYSHFVAGLASFAMHEKFDFSPSQ